MKNVEATFNDKTDQSDPTRREEYWTLVSHRMNIEKYIF